MTFRILFTLAILAGLATAPAAQTFRWHAEGDDHARVRVADWMVERVNRAVDRAAGHAPDGSSVQGGGGTDPCEATRHRDRDDDDVRHCEVREQSLPAGALRVDASPNGGIIVDAWDRSDIRVLAIVRTNARDDGRAKALAAGVQVQATGGRVSATGPDASQHEWWSVSYRINVPRRNDLDLASHNGGIAITGVSGRVVFETVNGGVRLTDLGGNVSGSTHNGGLTVNLVGHRWEGDGLDVETTNGGVTLAIPDGYNADLETRTHNGGFHADYPITMQGELNSRHGLHTTLGAGGAPVRVRTSNGGVRIARR